VTPAGAARAPAPEQTVAVVDAGPGSRTGPPPSVADLAENEERVWVAGGVIAGAMVTWAWMSRNPDGRFARAIRRLLYPARRPGPRTKPPWARPARGPLGRRAKPPTSAGRPT